MPGSCGPREPIRREPARRRGGKGGGEGGDGLLPSGAVQRPGKQALFVWDTAVGRLSFEALQRRVAARDRTATTLAAKTPAFFIAFDTLQIDGIELLTLPYAERRRRLEVPNGFVQENDVFVNKAIPSGRRSGLDGIDAQPWEHRASSTPCPCSQAPQGDGGADAGSAVAAWVMLSGRFSSSPVWPIVRDGWAPPAVVGDVVQCRTSQAAE